MINKDVFLNNLKNYMNVERVTKEIKKTLGEIDNWSMFWSSTIPETLLLSIEFKDGDYIELTTKETWITFISLAITEASHSASIVSDVNG